MPMRGTWTPPSNKQNEYAQARDDYRNSSLKHAGYAVNDEMEGGQSLARTTSQSQRETISGEDQLAMAPSLAITRDKSTMRDIGETAAKAATQGDVSTGRKPPSYKHGGVVPRTGMALLHKGEEVIPKEARDILGGSGAKLHAHEVHIRHTAEKGKYIAKHILKDKDGNPPTDGQRGEAEYSLGSPEEMMDHLHQHMVAPDQDDEESPAAEQG